MVGGAEKGNVNLGDVIEDTAERAVVGIGSAALIGPLVAVGLSEKAVIKARNMVQNARNKIEISARLTEEAAMGITYAGASRALRYLRKDGEQDTSELTGIDTGYVPEEQVQGLEAVKGENDPGAVNALSGRVMFSVAQDCKLLGHGTRQEAVGRFQKLARQRGFPQEQIEKLIDSRDAQLVLSGLPEE